MVYDVIVDAALACEEGVNVDRREPTHTDEAADDRFVEPRDTLRLIKCVVSADSGVQHTSRGIGALPFTQLIESCMWAAVERRLSAGVRAPRVLVQGGCDNTLLESIAVCEGDVRCNASELTNEVMAP